MTYIITGDTVGLALGAVSESATDVHEALTKARQMYETGMANITIKDEAGHEIEGDDLVVCIMGTKSISEDLQAN
jgi:hypothetical protein